MAGIADAFTIIMNSDGMKEFQEELKRNEKECETYSKQVETLTEELNKCEEEEKELKTRLEEARNATVKDEKAIANLEKALDKAKVATKQAAANLETAKTKADGFQKSVETLKGKPQYTLMQLGKNVMNLVKQLGLLAAVGMTVRKSLEFYEQGEQLGNLADKAGVAVEALQTLSKASGGDAESTASSITNIKENKESYQKAGIQIVEGDSSATFENVAKKMEGLKSEAEKLDLAASLGIDDNTAKMLAKGVDSYRESLKKAEKYKLYTKEDIERMRDYRQIQQDIKAGLQATSGAVYRMLLPVITAVAKVIRKITDWLAEHEGLVKIIGATLAVAAAIGVVIGVVMGLQKALALVMANPIVLQIMAVVAAIMVVIAIINDFIVFLQGGDSIIGELLNKWGYDTDAIRADILNAIEQLKAGFTSFMENVKAVGSAFIGVFQSMWAAVMNFWNGLPEPIKKLLKGVGLAALTIANPVAGLGVMTGGIAVGVGKKVMNKYKKNPQNAVPAGSQAAYYNSQSQNATNTKNSKTVNNKNTRVNANITVNVPSGDPHKVGAATKNAVQSLDNGRKA